MTAADWAAAVVRRPLSLAARTVAGQLADRARGGRVRVSPAEIASCCCLPVTAVANSLALLSSYGLLGQERGVLVLTEPGGAG